MNGLLSWQFRVGLVFIAVGLSVGGWTGRPELDAIQRLISLLHLLLWVGAAFLTGMRFARIEMKE